MLHPVTFAGDQTTQLAKHTTWLPPGNWIDRVFGTVIASGAQGVAVTRGWDLTEVPSFVKGGAVVPFIPDHHVALTGNANRQYPALAWRFYPGETLAFSRAYDDGGDSLGYTRNSAAWYSAQAVTKGSIVSVTLRSDVTWKEQRDLAEYEVRLVNVPPPLSVVVNGTSYAWSRVRQLGVWHYDAQELAVVVNVPPGRTSDPYANVTSVIFTFASVAHIKPTVLSGFRGAMWRSTLAKQLFDQVRADRNTYRNLTTTSMLGQRFALTPPDAAKIDGELASFASTFQFAVKETAAVKVRNAARRSRAIALVQGATEAFTKY